jgi:hypothetical protein
MSFEMSFLLGYLWLVVFSMGYLVLDAVLPEARLGRQSVSGARMRRGL